MPRVNPYRPQYGSGGSDLGLLIFLGLVALVFLALLFGEAETKPRPLL